MDKCEQVVHPKTERQRTVCEQLFTCLQYSTNKQKDTNLSRRKDAWRIRSIDMVEFHGRINVQIVSTISGIAAFCGGKVGHLLILVE